MSDDPGRSFNDIAQSIIDLCPEAEQFVEEWSRRQDARFKRIRDPLERALGALNTDADLNPPPEELGGVVAFLRRELETASRSA